MLQSDSKKILCFVVVGRGFLQALVVPPSVVTCALHARIVGHHVSACLAVMEEDLLTVEKLALLAELTGQVETESDDEDNHNRPTRKPSQRGKRQKVDDLPDHPANLIADLQRLQRLHKELLADAASAPKRLPLHGSSAPRAERPRSPRQEQQQQPLRRTDSFEAASAGGFSDAAAADAVSEDIDESPDMQQLIDLLEEFSVDGSPALQAGKTCVC